MRALFVGAGKMATALATAVVKNNVIPADEIIAADISEAARAAFTAATGVKCTDNAAKYAADVEVIFLAVKPQVAEVAVTALPKSKALVISICAGIPLAKLSGWFESERIIRVMPNTPLMVGKGASCFALGKAATAEDGAFAKKVLGTAGIAFEVQEGQLDAVTGLSGSGPAYVFELAKALALAGEAVGLSPDLSLELSIQTIVGAGEMLARKVGSPDQLRDAVTSPNGTTAAGLAIMAKDNFRKIIADTVIAARDRSVELGK